MSRLARSSFVFSALLLGSMAACRPSKAEVAQMQATLAQIQAQQATMKERLDALSHDEAYASESGRYEREELRNAMVELDGQLDGLQERVEKLETKPARPSQAGRPDPNEVYKVEIGDAPFKGPSTALVTIVAWTDFQCPYCSRVQPTMRELMTTYKGELRVVHMHNPLGFHPRAMPAALASEAARKQGKFWEMHDLLFANQKELTDENFRAWAKELGLNLRRFERDMEDPALRKRIEAQQAQGMTLGARGTPAFFINGRFLSGAQPAANFMVRIDEEMERAEKLLDKGVPRKRIYETVIADGKTKV